MEVGSEEEMRERGVRGAGGGDDYILVGL